MKPANTRNRSPWTTVCVPGRNDADTGAWFAHHRDEMRSIPARNREEANRIVAQRSLAASSAAPLLVTESGVDR